MSQKRKRVVLTLEQKLAIINRVEKGESVKKLSTEFGIGEQTVRDILKKKKDISGFVSSSAQTTFPRKTMKTSTLKDVDEAVYQWFIQRRAEGVPISGPMVSEKALWFHENLKIEEPFSASQGWLHKFKKRHGIRQLAIQGESLSGDNVAATLFIENFNCLVKKFDLTPDQIYNADESGLFWKMLPSKTLAAHSEKYAPGHKSSKERLTIMTCCNASGDHKLKLTVIGKAKKPRSFRGTEIRSLPCDYYNHPKAWMNQTIFSSWFKDKFVPSVSHHLKQKGLPIRAVLLLDNAPSHPAESTLTTEDGQIFVHYLPPNVTSLIQPMDQGVISSLKRRYKKIFLRFLLEENNSTDSLKEIVKKWNIKDAIFSVCEAWANLSPTTLKLSWGKILEQEDFVQESSEEVETESFLEIAKALPDFIHVDRDDMKKWLESEIDEEGFEQLTDNEIADLHRKDEPSTSLQSDYGNMSDEDEDSLIFSEIKKIKHNQALEATELLLNYFEQENADYSRIILLRTMRSDIRKEMLNKKQTKITDFFL
uniref:Unkown protein n=1 Tax=Riptortus pedestris TaxID=329032 RepID=R4WDS3_RIPPE|nr:unkown protein [Riptortus pedestris]